MVSTLSVSVGLEDIKQCQFPPSHIQLALFAHHVHQMHAYMYNIHVCVIWVI